MLLRDGYLYTMARSEILNRDVCGYLVRDGFYMEYFEIKNKDFQKAAKNNYEKEQKALGDRIIAYSYGYFIRYNIVVCTC